MSAQNSEGAVTRWRFYRDHFTQCDCDLFAAKDGGYVDADDYSALLSRAQRLEAALRFMELFFPRADEGSTLRFERIALAFERATGVMMNGKDAPPDYGLTHDERQAAYDKWVSDNVTAARAVLGVA